MLFRLRMIRPTSQFDCLPEKQSINAGLGASEDRSRAFRPFSFCSILGICALFFFASVGKARAGSIVREVWNNIPGTAVTDLTNDPRYPNTPDSTNLVTTAFESPTDVLDNYGQRMHGYILPPVTGDYTFWIATDDNGELWLSTDATPATKRLIAQVTGWTSSREWTKEPAQQSAPIRLTANQPYYISALQKEGGGGDNLAVRWLRPDGVDEGPIPATYLLPWGTAFTAPRITQQPANTTAVEGQTANFTVQADPLSPASAQWQKNGANISGATDFTLSYSPVLMADNQAHFRVLLTNQLGSVTSSDAILTVTPDTTPPTLLSAINFGQNSVQLVFSEPVANASALTAGNYQISSGITVSGVSAGSDSKTVVLNTSTLTYGTTYRVTVNNVQDRAATPNTMAAGSQISFTALEYAPQSVGTSGSIRAVSGGFAVTGGGTDIGGTADQFQFGYQLKTGDFDVRARVQSLDPSDAWAKAGLIARESFSASARFAGIFSTPANVGSFFESRATAGAAAASSGSFPVNYPNTWLRLRRAGNQFTGFASFDGQTWTQLGSVTIAMPATVNFGMAVTSHDATKTTTATFQDIGNAAGTIVTSQKPEGESLGPSSRKTGLVISEIMYKPAARADGKNLEFIEIYNTNPYSEDISGYRITGNTHFTFPPNTVLPGGGFAVVAAVPADIQAVYGIANVFGPYDDPLNKSGVIRLENNVGAVYLEVPYSSNPPWPVAADGAGHSLVLARPSYGEANAQAWSISDTVGGSPGRGEAFQPSPLRSVVINEFLAHTDLPLLDYIELYNHSSAAVDISGCFLSDDPTTNIFKIPGGTVIPANGFVYFDESALGFRLSASGETIYFVNPDASRVLDAVQFEPQANGVSFGRFPDGSADFYPLASRTPGQPNGGIRIHDVVINEIMYKPISGDENDEYVELYNKGAATIDLGGWSFTSGISFVFPSNTLLRADSYIVVAKNATNLIAHYPNLTAANTLGNFSGKLSGSGERLALGYPDKQISTNSSGTVKTNIVWIIADEVTYGAGGRWGQWANGGGSSLELIDPRSNHRLAYNWGDSDETTKAPWTNIEAFGVLDNGANYEASIAHFQVGLLGAGECLIDKVEVLPGTAGANYATNPDFESGLTGWATQGSHVRSSVEATEGYQSTHSLHIRASDQMWTGGNSVQGTLTTTTLASGQTATLRFKARWLRGWPEALLRLNGNWLEASGRMQVPLNLGTPGARNSRFAANGGPAIFDIKHSPSLPAAGQAAIVSARVHDPDGIQTLSLKYRVDPSATYTTVNMVDNGTGGDAIAGDGIYSAQIPGQAARTVVAFYLQATDTRGISTRFPIDPANNGPVPEAVICFGDTDAPSAYGSYHLWLTQSTISRWSGLPNMSNEPHDGTFVSGDRIIYNMKSRYAGSPYHQQFDSPVGGQCHYHCEMPEDDQYLGTTSFNKIHAPGNGPFDDNTIQREQTSYWFVRKLGLPWNYRRYVAMYVNGNRRGTLMEDTQVPNGDVVKENFSSQTDGQLFKLQPWFEFDPNGQGFNNNSWCTLNRFTTTGGAKKLARYRWNYLTRRASATASDYTNVFALVDAANNPANSTALISAMDSQVDVEQWMRTFAVEHAVGNWDAFGCNNAQNMYAYKPDAGKWNLLIWDYNIVLGNSGSWGPGQNLFTFNGADTGMPNLYNSWVYRRAYWRAMKELINGPMLPTNVNPLMQEKYDSFVAEGLNVAAPGTVGTWIDSARTSIASQLAAAGGNTAFKVNASGSFSTNKAVITLTGTAPVEVKDITVNGIAYPVTWTDLKTWSLPIALGAGANSLTIAGADLNGTIVPGTSSALTVNFTGTAESAAGHLIINEIMYNAAAPGAGFIEIYNSSQNTAFDLTGFRLDGADFSFPGGSLIQPHGYVVVAEDPAVFVSTYGASIPVAGTFNGKLSNNGETLKLVKPGATPAQDVIIDQATYGSDAPWPTQANGFGPSLQLVDPLADHSRVANWAVGSTNTTSPTPQWKYASVTGTASSSTLYVYLASGGDIYIDDLKLVAGSTAEVGANLINNGDFEAALAGSWTTTANTAGSQISTTIKHSGNASIHLVCTAGGTTKADSLWQDTQPLTQNAQYTLSFWYLAPSASANTLTMRLSGSGVRIDQPITPDVIASTALYTPGAANSVKATLSLPSLWLNEINPANSNGITDHLGHHAAWAELYNSGSTAISLSGYYLSPSYSNLTQWALPSGATIQPGQFLVVYLDGQPGESTATEFHTSFSAAPANGSLVLANVAAGKSTVIDYLNYDLLSPDHSYGAFPDATPAHRRYFGQPTPAASNSLSTPVPSVFINEWMASNTATLPDPSDNKFHDWFELFNAGSEQADLSGFTLTDVLTNKTQFIIPQGVTIPAHGYLLVWADDGLAPASQSEVHANFSLKASGEAIALFTPDGTLVDSVTFGAQASDISEGRFPNGAGAPYQTFATATPGAGNAGTGGNSAPTISTIRNQQLIKGNTLTVQAAAQDPDSNQTLSFSLAPGAAPGAAINASSGVFTWSPLATQDPGSYTFTVRVTDSGTPALSAATSFSVQLSAANTKPLLNPIADQTVLAGNALNLTVTASDSDLPAQALTYSLDPGAPLGATIQSSSGAFSWTPTAGQAGDTYLVIVRVSDNGTPPLSDTKSFSISVPKNNVPPTLDSIADKTLTKGSSLRFTAVAHESDAGQSLVFTLAAGAPSGAAIDPSSGLFIWTPADTQTAGDYPITVKVTDSGTPPLSASQSFTAHLLNANTTPLLSPIADKSIIAGNQLVITNAARDADTPAQTLTFSLDPGAPANAAIQADSGLFTWTPDLAKAGTTNQITIRVTDNGTPPLSDSKSFNIVVLKPNAAPTLDPIGDKSLIQGGSLRFTVAGHDPDANQTLAFSLGANPPSGSSIDSSTGVFTWTPASGQAPGDYPLTIIVADNGTPGLTASQTITIHLLKANSSPSLTTLADRTVAPGALLSFTASATDSDAGQTLTYSLDPGAPAGATIQTGTGLFSWTPTPSQGGKSYPITVRVTDNGTPSLADTKTFTVTVSAAPPLAWKGVAASGPNSFTLSWAAQPGITYRVEYIDRLGQTNWTLLSESQVLGGDGFAVDNTRSPTAERFYRLSTP